MDKMPADESSPSKRPKSHDEIDENKNIFDQLSLDPASSGSRVFLNGIWTADISSTSSLVDSLLNSLAREEPQHTSSKQQALDICLEAVELLKFQMKEEGYIDFLPTWIKDSEFVRQYKEDYPGEVLKLEDKEKIFELPHELDEDSVVKVMDNIRYFGVNDPSIFKYVFEFYVKTSNHHLIESHKMDFYELIVLWDNVAFTVRTNFEDERGFATQAARGNYLIALKYAHENGCPWDEETCSGAALNAHLDCLKYAHENGCPWDKETCTSAGSEAHLDSLKYAHENGCPWDEETCSGAAGGGHLDCLQYAHEKGCPWYEQTCTSAAIEGSLECLKYARENGCAWDKMTCSWAALTGHLDCLKYAHENGCPWNEGTCSAAANGGHLNCLKYAHGNGCPWDESTCSGATDRGHLDCLKYAHENGCPWDKETCSEAANGGHLDCLQYAHENGCPGSSDFSYLLQ